MTFSFLKVAACGLLAAGLLTACGRAPESTPSDGSSPGDAVSVADVRADFDDLYERLRASHYDLYARRDKAAYDALFTQMRASFDHPMSPRDVRTRFQRFVAYGRVAHAHIELPLDAYSAWRDAGGTKFPLSLRVAKDAVVVTSNLSGVDAVSPGDRLIAVDGEAVDHWLGRLEAYISADNRYLADTQLEDLLPAILWLADGSRPSYALDVRHADGSDAHIVVPAITVEQTKAAFAKQPKTLALDRNARDYRMATPLVAYLRPGPFYNTAENADMWDPTSFATFIDAAFESFADSHAEAVVIDLRDNPGGDNSFSDRMVSWFADKPYRFASDFRVKVSQAAIDSNKKRIDADPSEKNSVSRQYAKAYAAHSLGDVFTFDIPTAQPRAEGRFTGKVFLLINRRSYSNTVTVAALAQDNGFATIVGEETSDLATTYGASETFQLSHTGIVVTFPKAYIVRPNGSTDARGVIPHVAIETPAIESVDDPVLKRTIDIATTAVR